MFLTHRKSNKHVPSVFDQFNRMFEDDFFKPFFNRSMDSWSGQYPVADIFETKDDYVLKLEVPGMSKDDITVEIDNNVLYVKGERKMDNEIKEDNYHRLERYSGSFSRAFNLPGEVDGSKVKAKMKDGILELNVPKAEVMKAKTITIN